MSRARTIDIDYDELPRIRDREIRRVRGYESDDDPAPRRDRPRDQDYEYRRKSYVYDNEPARYRRREYDQAYETPEAQQAMVPYNQNPVYAQGNQEVAVYDRRSRDVYDRRPDRRRDNYSDDDDSDEDRSSHSRRRHHKHGRRDHRRKDRSKDDEDESEPGDNSADEGIMWFNGEKRKHGTFVQRNFDSSYEGITAAIAGGLIGGMTARRFGGEDSNKVKTLAGVAAGAAVVNAGENWYRVFTEERAERKEKKREEAAQRHRS